MFLSNRDIKWAIECGKLIVDPPPESFNTGYDETSIDLHLDSVKAGARVWDIAAYRRDVVARGGQQESELALGDLNWSVMAGDYLVEVPQGNPGEASPPVYRRGSEVVVRQLGFVLWTTKERVGTPNVSHAHRGPGGHPELICFVNAKSTCARTGIMVHFTAPTIHAGWAGRITLEITNLGPFDLVLREDDKIAQLTVATISSAPDMSLRKSQSRTQGQVDPGGPARKKDRKGKG